MRKLSLWLIVIIGITLLYTGCGGAGVKPSETPPVTTEPSPTTEKPNPTAITVDPEERPAEAAILAADWTKAYEIYTKLTLSNLASPLAEYYFYRLLWVTNYSSGTVGEALGKTIQTIIDTPQTNKSLRALARWVKANGDLKQGNLKSAQAEIENLGFIKDFLFIGPFENEEETGFKKEYPVEKEMNLDATYEGKHGTNQWFRSRARADWGWVDLTNLFRLNDDVLAYALTFINSPVEQEVAFRLGSDGAVKVWLNDQLILESDTYRKLYLDQNAVGGKLVRGWNKLLIKTGQKRGPWRFIVRLTSPEGKTITGLEFTNDPAKIKTLEITNPEKPREVKVKGDVLDYFREKTTQNPNDAVSLARAGFIYDIKQSLDENDRTDRDALKKALELKPDATLWHLLLAGVEPERNKRLEEYRAALKSAPKSPLVQYEFSRAYTGDLEWYKDLTIDWWDIFETWFEGKEFDYEKEVRRAQKDTLSSKKRSFPVEKKEMDYLSEALRLKPDFVLAKIALARCYERRGGMWNKEAIRLFKEIQTLTPHHPEIQKALIKAEETYLGIDEKISRYSELLKDNFTDGRLRQQLINLYKEKCQLDKAKGLMEETKTLNPYQYQTYIQIAEIWRSQEKIAEGIKSLEQGRLVAPEATAVLDKLASFYHLSGATEKAVATWEYLLKIRPQDKEVSKHLKVLKGETEEFWKGYEENLATYIDKAKKLERSSEKESAAWLLYNQIIKVKPNGTSSVFVQQVIRIFDDKGRNEYESVYAYPHGHDYYVASKSEVKRAKVIRKDGTEIEGQFYEDSSSARFPRLEVDDIITFECQIDEVGEARYKGYFGLMSTFQGSNDPVKTAKITLISPKTKPIYFQVVGAKADVKESEKDDLIIRKWEVSDIPEIKQEYFKPSDYELSPYIHLSTFKTWDEVAEWLWGIAKDQFESSPEIKSAVTKATKGLTTTRDKIKAIYQLQVSNVRYEFIDLEAHGFKPFKALDTFARKYGDCKDTATLLATMLKEAGIPANIVVVRADPTSLGVVDTKLPSMKIFNHMIAQVPDVDGQPLFLDGTARYCGAEELPWMDQGAVVFVVSPLGKGNCSVLPYEPPEKNLTEINADISLSADHSAVIETTMNLKGQAAPALREQLQEGTKRELLMEQMVNQYLSGSKVEDVTVSDIADYNKPVEIKFTVKAPQISRAEGTQTVFKPVLLPPALMSIPLKYFALAETRHYDVVIPYRERNVSKTSFRIPAGYQIKSVPGDFSLDNEYARCQITLKKEGADRINVEYLLEIKVARIPRDGYAKLRDFCAKVEKAADEEVVLEKK